MRCAISALESYTGNNKRGLTRGFPFLLSRRGNRVRSVEVVERPPESKRELLHLSPRDTIRYLNRLKESEEAATPPAHGKPLLSGLHQVH